MSIVSAVQVKKRIPFLQIIKTIAAAIVAWFIAAAVFQDTSPVFAAIAALIVVQPSVNQSVGKALERSLGAILGVAIALVLVLLFGETSWIPLLAITCGIILAWSLKLAPATANQIALSAMLVIALGQIDSADASQKILETVLGAAIGILINAFVAPPVTIEPANKAIATLGGDIAQILEDIGSVLQRETSYEVLNNIYVRSRALRAEYNTALATVTRAQESLRFNARKSKHAEAIATNVELLKRLAVLTTRVIGLSRGVRDNYDESVITEPAIGEIAEELMRAGHDLRLLVRDAGLPAVVAPHPATEEIPALTQPINLSAPKNFNWILVGFLMENLRRIRGEITGESDD